MSLRPQNMCAIAAIIAMASASLCISASAQRANAKEPPGSFTGPKPGGVSKAPAALASPVEEPDVADAILGETLDQIYNQADKHFEKGEWNHSVGLFKMVEEGDPHDVKTYCDVAYMLWSSDRNDQAIEQLKVGLARNPNTSYMYDELGTHYWLHLHDAEKAIPYLEKAIKFPCKWPTYHTLAFCYQKLGQWDNAVKTWRESTKFGDDPIAAMRLKQAEAHLKGTTGK